MIGPQDGSRPRRRVAGFVARCKYDVLLLMAVGLSMLGFVTPSNTECPATSFMARCRLHNGVGTFVSKDNHFKRCTPKSW